MNRNEVKVSEHFRASSYYPKPEIYRRLLSPPRSARFARLRGPAIFSGYYSGEAHAAGGGALGERNLGKNCFSRALDQNGSVRFNVYQDVDRDRTILIFD